MGGKSEECVWEHGPYTLGKRLVHLAIAKTTAEDMGSYLWASQDTIARWAKVGRDTVNAAMQTMVEDGALDPVDYDDLPGQVQARIPDSRVRIYRVLVCQACGRHWGLPHRDLSEYPTGSGTRPVGSTGRDLSDPPILSSCHTKGKVRGARARRALSPFPEPFVVTTAMQEWLGTTDLGHVEWRDETMKFKDWALANDIRKRDWVAAWRTWMRRADRYAS